MHTNPETLVAWRVIRSKTSSPNISAPQGMHDLHGGQDGAIWSAIFAKKCVQKIDVLAIPIGQYFFKAFGRNLSEISYYIRQALQLTLLFFA